MEERGFWVPAARDGGEMCGRDGSKVGGGAGLIDEKKRKIYLWAANSTIRRFCIARSQDKCFGSLELCPGRILNLKLTLESRRGYNMVNVSY